MADTSNVDEAITAWADGLALQRLADPTTAQVDLFVSALSTILSIDPERPAARTKSPSSAV